MQPRKLRKCLYSFDAPGLSHYGGLTLFLQFCKCIELKRFLARRVRWGVRGRRWTPTELFLAHLLLTAAGVGRLENSHALHCNGALAALMGVEAFPTVRALRGFLLGLDERALQDLSAAHDAWRERAWDQGSPHYSAVLDLDTTALRVYGHAEGAVKGYVPHYAGLRCYNVRLLTEALSGTSLRGELRPGNVNGSVEASAFVEGAVPLLPKHIARERIRLRADSAFYDKSFVESLENQGLSHVIDVRITGPVRRRLEGVRYEEFRRGYEAGEMAFRPCHWTREVRLVIVRRLVSLVEPPVTLFTLRDYAYTVQLTNLALRPEGVWRFYCDRAGQELLIRELKNAYALGRIPTHAFRANRAYLEMLLWAYDLIGGFRRACLPPDWQRGSLSTLRRDLWSVPGHLVRTGRRYRMRLPEHFEHEAVVRHVQRKLRSLKPLDES